MTDADRGRDSEHERQADTPAEDTDVQDVDAVEAGQQDYGMRNVAMSNAFPGFGQPAAGAVIGSRGELDMQPETDEEVADETPADSRRD